MEIILGREVLVDTSRVVSRNEVRAFMKKVNNFVSMFVLENIKSGGM